MQHKYGSFNKEQCMHYKTQLHKKMFWLLLYEDPKTKDKYPDVNLQRYFRGLMLELDGLNSLLSYPVAMISILSLLERARMESESENSDYSVYRKLVLDAHELVDKLLD